jgi:2'-5' RNA ligase
MKIRTFIAVTIGDDVRARTAKLMERLRPAAPNVKWVEPEGLHWTLSFLGNVDGCETGDVCAVVAEAALEHEPFDLEIRGAGAFPSPDRPRTLWLGVGEGRDQMIALQASVEKSLESLGFRGEARRYTPHLTIGRPGRGQSPPELAAELANLADFHGGTTLVDEVTIFSSELTRNGPIYDPLGFAPLAP